MTIIHDAILWLNDPLNWTNPNGIIARTEEHLWISGAAVGLACAVSWPVGVWMGHVGRGGPAVVAMTNLSRAVPTVALLTILPLTVIGFGPPAIILALALFAIPPLLANAYLGVREVDPQVRDAGRGMGLSGWQLLRSVELPLAVPYLANGLRIAAVQVLATATLAAYVNGGGLGMIISRGFGLGLNAGGGQVLAGGLLVALLCLLADGLLVLVERAALPKALRRTDHRPPRSAADPITPTP
ncbi:ABC transporter permease [Catellatospora sp. KI3]|uniref:ABC transporter permease n=1 Tax=Catellatospora sp. KI3 TaxID=3041620 RepID=UPI00248310E2|nr:ABC transporter permease [Catellatospora sp. KI3]MDI1464553.1 ABC transporter permease [Catellatospora sp. KI3]